MLFKDRSDAGRELARHLTHYADRPDTVVLGVPRGGILVAAEIATTLHAPLDIFLCRKLGMPGNEELAFGAVVAGDGQSLNWPMIRRAGLTREQIAEISAETRSTLDQRASLYLPGRRLLPLAGKIVILVDDGVATGSTVSAALHAIRQSRPKKLILAVPVAPQCVCARLQREADMLVLVHTPADFYTVGQFYIDFSQTHDEEVTALLARGNRHLTAGTAPPSGSQVPQMGSPAISSDL